MKIINCIVWIYLFNFDTLIFHLKVWYNIVCSFSEKIKEIDKFISNCDLNRLMQELIGNYIMMEEYFMREMVLKVWPCNIWETGMIEMFCKVSKYLYVYFYFLWYLDYYNHLFFWSSSLIFQFCQFLRFVIHV